GVRLPDVGGAGALAGRPGRWTAARLWINAAVPHGRRGVRPVVTRTCPPGLLVGASGDGAGRRGACRPAQQHGLESRHAVAVRLACTCALRGCDPKKLLVGAAEVGVTTRSAKLRSDPILQNFLAQAFFARSMFGHSTGPFSSGKPR